jgi:hypothetical protein
MSSLRAARVPATHPGHDTILRAIPPANRDSPFGIPRESSLPSPVDCRAMSPDRGLLSPSLTRAESRRGHTRWAARRRLCRTDAACGRSCVSPHPALERAPLISLPAPPRLFYPCWAVKSLPPRGPPADPQRGDCSAHPPITWNPPIACHGLRRSGWDPPWPALWAGGIAPSPPSSNRKSIGRGEAARASPAPATEGTRCQASGWPGQKAANPPPHTLRRGPGADGEPMAGTANLPAALHMGQQRNAICPF